MNHQTREDLIILLEYIIDTEAKDFRNWCSDEGKNQDKELISGKHPFAIAGRVLDELGECDPTRDC